MYSLVCVECGSVFEAKGASAKTCSDVCRRARHRRSSKAYVSRNPQKRKECANRYARANRVHKEPEPFICEHCGKEFLSVRSSRFCSRKCRKKSWDTSEKGLESKHKFLKKRRNKEHTPCVVCGTLFVRHANSKTCSTRCSTVLRDRYRRSETHKKCQRVYAASNRAKDKKKERLLIRKESGELARYMERFKESDYYVAKRLNMSVSECPPDLLEAKRSHLKLTRLLKEVAV